MNGKTARMLRLMRRSSKTDKRLWHKLTPNERGAISLAHKSNEKLMHIDFLPLRDRRVQRI